MQKKILFILLIAVISMVTMGADKESKKQAKNQKIYEVKSKFFYSDDGGITYGDSRKEFKVGERVYMKLDIEITEKKGEGRNLFFFIGGGAAVGTGAGAVAGSFIPVLGNIIGAIGGATAGGIVGTVSYFATKPNLDVVECKLQIPNITSVDARYFDGSPITPIVDEFLGITTYPIKIKISGKKSEEITNSEWSFTFQFIPNAESEITMKLTFDDNIAEEYGMINTIIFVK